MVFTQFKSIGEVIKTYHLSVRDETFVKTTPIYIAPEVLHQEIQFSLRQKLYRQSDDAVCEQLIHPILRSLWLNFFLAELLLWSHTAFEVTDEFCVTPDYVFSERTLQYDTEVLERPVLIFAQAKKDNFQDGWAQCLAEMVAAQIINDNPQLTVYGIVTNGIQWEFGKLNDKILLKDYNIDLTITDLDKLYAALYYILSDCKQQLALNKSI